jgi:hypothetical protein
LDLGHCPNGGCAGGGENCPGCILWESAVVCGADPKYIIAKSGDLQDGVLLRDLDTIG